MSILIDILRQHHQALEIEYSSQLSNDMHKAIYAMLMCKTAQQRQSLWACNHCSHHDQTPLFCGHRSCPQCQQNTTSQWLDRQKAKRLSVDYFMVTFTLPFELRVLARQQPKALYQLMFDVSSSVLKDFAARLGLGNIGFTSVLHTVEDESYTHTCILWCLMVVMTQHVSNGVRVNWVICLMPLHWQKFGEQECLMPLINTQPCL